MKKNGNLRAALAVMAAVAGTGFSSGRETVLFFSQTGNASWYGIFLSSILYGLFCAVANGCARRSGASDFCSLTIGLFGRKRARCAAVLHIGAMILTAGIMLCAAGRLGELALPFHNARWMGTVSVLGTALAMNLRGRRMLPAAGAAAFALCLLFYTSMFLDDREIPVPMRYVTISELSGSAIAALTFGFLHAAMNASAATSVIVRFSSETTDPVRFGMICGMGMLTVLSAANAAVLRGGEKLLSQMYPAVVLAARWGTAGYYTVIAVMSICTAATLAAMISGLRDCGYRLGGKPG